MGQEAQCTARFGDQASAGKALLESHELLFRGDFRLAIPFRAMQSIEAREGELIISFSDGVAAFDLGPRAEKWAEKIRNPRSLLDKLGVKPDSTVAVLGVDDSNFWDQLRRRAASVSPTGPDAEVDLVFLAADDQEDLQSLQALQDRLKRNGAIWVVCAKGKQAQLKDIDVMASAKEAGLVDVKVVSFSNTHTALKLVIPRSSR